MTTLPTAAFSFKIGLLDPVESRGELDEGGI
jgi:hypothetical protein